MSAFLNVRSWSATPGWCCRRDTKCSLLFLPICSQWNYCKRLLPPSPRWASLSPLVHQQCRVLKAESGCGCWYQLLAGKKSRHHNLHMPCRMQFTGISCAAGDNVYSECDLVVRKLLWLRMMNKQGADDANMALAARDTFVQVCLMGQCPDGKPGVPSVELAQEVCAPLALLPLDPSTCAFVGSHTVDYSSVASGYGVHLTACKHGHALLGYNCKIQLPRQS